MTTTVEPQCIRCKHYRPSILGTGSCGAFPDGIPFEVYTGEESHTTPIEGDRGVQFEERETNTPLPDVDPYEIGA